MSEIPSNPTPEGKGSRRSRRAPHLAADSIELARAFFREEPGQRAKKRGSQSISPRTESGKEATTNAKRKGRKGVRPPWKRPLGPERNAAEKKKHQAATTRIANRFGLSRVFSRVLAGRGFGANKGLERYLQPALQRDLPNYWKIRDLRQACERIEQHIRKGSKIAICCDYDVDGTSSAAILARALKALGADFEIFTPDRFKDGYGLNEKMVRKLKKQGSDLMVTLDFGTTNKNEIDLARSLGLETIVVDHHKLVGDTACPDVFVNPRRTDCQYEDGQLCTAGIAFQLVRGLRETLLNSSDRKLAARAVRINEEDSLALAALGTVADLVPLTGGNRAIVSCGLQEISRTSLHGVRALLEVCGVQWPVEATDIGFLLGPLINAAGRMLRDAGKEGPGAMLPVRLLMSEDETEARELAVQLKAVNEKRKEKVRSVLAESLEQVQLNGAPGDALVVRVQQPRSGGVIGIVAARLVDLYHRPVIVLAGGKRGTLGGSARSIPGIQLTEVIGRTGLPIRYGGHEGAAGLEIHEGDLKKFSKAFEREVRKGLRGLDTRPVIKGDVEITLRELEESSDQIFSELDLLEPSGRMNRAPKFFVRNAQIVSISKNDDKNFIGVKLRQGESYVTAYLWYANEHPAIQPGNYVDLVAQIRPDPGDEYRDMKTLNLHLLAVGEHQPKKNRKK